MGQVVLAENHSALSVLHTLLADATKAFPEALGTAALPADPGTFRKSYPEVLPRFESARLTDPRRHEIARHVAAALQQHVHWEDDSGRRSLLQDALTESATPLPLNRHGFAGEPGWQPNIVYRGERFESARLTELGTLLVERGMITADAGAAFRWIADEGLDNGTLRLNGRKVALLGAGAEMAPTRIWLEAGADVLWLDTQPPPQSWRESSALSGRLWWPEGNTDLLAEPAAVLATLIAFADGAPLDLGLYAYAPGQARELRLTACMNALVNALPPDLIASVTILVSPTTPTALSLDDLAAMRARLEARPAWEAICARIGLLGREFDGEAPDHPQASRTVVGIQGGSYQAAQYLGKILIAETWTEYGPPGSATPRPLRVSANTAAITRTRSLDHPVFTAAFAGAAAFGVETLAPRQSRPINGLLAVHDWLHPNLPVPGSVRVHGGIHTLPYPLGTALRVAAAIGFARSPRLLRGLLAR